PILEPVAFLSGTAVIHFVIGSPITMWRSRTNRGRRKKAKDGVAGGLRGQRFEGQGRTGGVVAVRRARLVSSGKLGVIREARERAGSRVSLWPEPESGWGGYLYPLATVD